MFFCWFMWNSDGLLIFCFRGMFVCCVSILSATHTHFTHTHKLYSHTLHTHTHILTHPRTTPTHKLQTPTHVNTLNTNSDIRTLSIRTHTRTHITFDTFHNISWHIHTLTWTAYTHALNTHRVCDSPIQIIKIYDSRMSHQKLLFLIFGQIYRLC